MEKPIKFIKPKLKTKRYHKFHAPIMSIEEYEKITQPENLKFKSGFTIFRQFLNSDFIYNKKLSTYVSFYSGKVKNKKANGWGKEIIMQTFYPPGNEYYDMNTFNPTVDEYYEGEWKNGKRDGYGECYNYHPLIGEPVVFDNPYDTKPRMYFLEEDGEVYKGYWKNGKKVSK